jgi:hypothetical protein
MTRFQDVMVPGPLSIAMKLAFTKKLILKQYGTVTKYYCLLLTYNVPGVVNSGGGFKNCSVVDPHWLPCRSGSSFFYLNADPDPGNQNNADTGGSGSCQTLPSTKIKFLHETLYLM